MKGVLSLATKEQLTKLLYELAKSIGYFNKDSVEIEKSAFLAYVQEQMTKMGIRGQRVIKSYRVGFVK